MGKNPVSLIRHCGQMDDRARSKLYLKMCDRSLGTSFSFSGNIHQNRSLSRGRVYKVIKFCKINLISYPQSVNYGNV